MHGVLAGHPSDPLPAHTPLDQVTDDPELLAWWDEVQHKAHPDIKTGWPALQTVTDLRDILTTIAWTATAHHAAVGNGARPLCATTSPDLAP